MLVFLTPRVLVGQPPDAYAFNLKTLSLILDFGYRAGVTSLEFIQVMACLPGLYSGLDYRAKRQGRATGYYLASNILVPSRTILAPSSMATI